MFFSTAVMIGSFHKAPYPAGHKQELISRSVDGTCPSQEGTSLSSYCLAETSSYAVPCTTGGKGQALLALSLVYVLGELFDIGVVVFRAGLKIGRDLQAIRRLVSCVAFARSNPPGEGYFTETLSQSGKIMEL
jgi:hypothetical protein